MLEKTLESTLDFKKTKPVNPKRNQSWIFIGGTDAEAKAPILWPPDAKSRLIRKDTDAGKDWRQEEKGKTEDKMVGWHHQFYGHEFEQPPRDGEGQESLACFSPWAHKDLDTTERLNSNKNIYMWQPCVCMLSHFSCVWLCHPMDLSQPGSSIHGILLARILEWVAMPFSKVSSQSRDQTHISCSSCTSGRFFTTEPLGKVIYDKLNHSKYNYFNEST